MFSSEKGGSSDTGGQCLVSWNVLCSPRGSGGLGIRRLRDLNVSLLSKWWWKLLSNHQSPWVHVVQYNYYYRRRPLDLQDKLRGRVSPFWREVLCTTNAFKLGLWQSCGQGTSVKFWKDYWIREVLLAYAFHSLFRMTSDKDAWCMDQFTNLINDWALSFRLPLSPTWLQMLADLICTLLTHAFQDVLDRVTWKVGPSPIFTVGSQYQPLLPSQPQDKAAKNLWKVATPLKVKITTWLAIRDRLFTGLYLHRRHIRPRSSCIIC